MYDAHVDALRRTLSRAPGTLHWKFGGASGYDYGIDSDAMQVKRREADHEVANSAPLMHLLLEILRLCTDARQEVRMVAIFRTS